MRHLAMLCAAWAITTSAGASGLLAPTDQTLPPLRVTDHLVTASIHDGIALTKVTQTFHNDTGRRLEATYIFPLPELADLTDFQMTFNGKMVKGRVLPAEEAARIYESIVRQAKDPGLIEFIGRRLLQMRVFPIEPGSDTTIQVQYQQVCRPISGMTGYHYPLRTSKTAGQAYGTVRFALELDTKAPLKSIWSPTHAVEIVRKGEHAAKIAYEASGGSLEDDFMLLYGTDSSDLGLSVVAYKPTDAPGHFVLMLTPKQLWPEREYQPQDVVFVLDTSGSMAGEKIKQARQALRYCVAQLDERDRFSVVRFSTGFDVMSESLVGVTDQTRKQAEQFIDQFTAAGGTNISETLEHVVGMKPTGEEGRPFVVVFLTDGQGNRDAAEILATLKKAAGEGSGLRIFPFGVGHDVNTKLLDQLAGVFVGHTTYVQPGENLELVLGDFFSVISQPVLTNLRLVLPEIGATERFPAKLGDLYHGQQVTIAGRFSSPTVGPVTLKAMRGGETVEYVWPDVAFTNTAEAGYVPSVWAGRKIAYLIDQIRTAGESKEMIAEVVALSQEYGIQTPYTSWLVDPERHREVIVAWQRGGGGRPAPGAGGGGGGGGRSPGPPPMPGRRRVQQRVLEGQLGVPMTADLPAPGANRFYGDEFDDLDLVVAEHSVTEEAGKGANVIARKNAELRDLRSRDEERLDLGQLPIQKIDGRWYNRLGRYLVDASIDEDTNILVVKFGSEAYFELARKVESIRKPLAASQHVAVRLTDDAAVLVSDRTGIEEFSDENRKQVGLAGS